MLFLAAKSSSIREGLKIKLIIFAEYSAKGYPLPPSRKIINISPTFWMPGLGEGGGGHFDVFTLLNVSEHSEHFCFWLFLWWGKN